MIRVITALGNNQNILLELRDWLKKKHPDISVEVFFRSKFEMQLGIYIEFFEYKNYYILATPNSYVIDYVNYELNDDVNNEVLKQLRETGLPYLIAKYDLKTNEILLIYELAILDIIKLINKIPF